MNTVVFLINVQMKVLAKYEDNNDTETRDGQDKES